MEDDENDLDNEGPGDEEDILGGEGESKSVSFEPSRFGRASAAAKCWKWRVKRVGAQASRRCSSKKEKRGDVSGDCAHHHFNN